ncbi:right-handed parallel beta-helix repeat-containing protein [Micromonospora zamorensis]|uniref:Right-handed parallel beta-helix repeat-containing protein n=1 Tax=Micromonospora zamorensis TaxID=709883 RepID=A0ABZ1PHH5_9ACTN|nr:right-handed parallel beta-helix repeat-containing protein [Micromonospora zamorensis]
MSNDVTSTDGGASTAPPTRRRRALWVAGVAGLTGVVGLAALGGVAARDDKPKSDQVSDAQPSTNRQSVSDAGGADEGAKEADARDDEWSGDGWSGFDDQSGKDDKGGDKNDEKDRTKQVPCDTDKLIQEITFANSRNGGVLELAKGCTYNLTRNDYEGNGLPVITERITLKGEHTTIGRDATADYFRILNVGPGGHLTLKGLSIKGGQTLQRAMTMDAATVWAPYSPSVRTTAAAQLAKPTTPAAKPGAAAEPAAAAAKPATAAEAAKPAAAAASATKSAAAKPVAEAAKPVAAAGPAAVPLVEEPGFNDGAGVLVQPGGRAEILDSELLYNQSGGNGGGLANFGSTRLSKTTVAHNTALFFGGGIFNAGVLQVDESKVKDNTGIIGGGGIANGAARIFTDSVDGGSVWVYKSEITDNETLGFGGGVLDVEGTTTLHYTTVSGNTAVLAGGGVAVADSQLTLKDATVAKNSTAGVGGGLAVAFDSAATVENSKINDNTAGFFGAGLFNEDSVTTLRDSEVVGNRAVGPFGSGGGIYNTDGGEITLRRTKVTHNFATLPPGGISNGLGSFVRLDDESSVSANRPTNCLNVPGCF